MGGMAQGFESILKKLIDAGEPVLDEWLFGLSDLNRQDMAAFIQTWPQIPASRRCTIARRLASLAEEHIEVHYDALFRHLLDDPEGTVQVAAVEGLWENEDTRLIKPLVRLLEEGDDPQVRAAAAISLGRFVLLGELEEIETAAAFQAESALWSVLHSTEEDLEVQRRAVESIAYSGEMAVRDVILNAYYHDDDRMRMSAVFAMGRSADPYWRALVLQELLSDHPGLRFEAARAAGELELTDAVPGLLQLLDEDEDIEVVQAAITALGQIGGQEARRALSACLEADNEAIRDAAEEALELLEFNEISEDIPLIAQDLSNNEGYDYLMDEED